MDLLTKFLRLGVAEGEGAPAPDPETTPGPESGDEDLDELLNAAESGEGTPAAEPEESPALKEARRRAEEAERRASEAEQRSRLQAEIAPPQRQVADPDFEREEAELAQARQSGATAEQLAWLQWKIDSNRKIRTSERSSQSALFQAQDLADRTAFERLEITKPQVYKRYAERVEKAVADLRAKNQQPAPRLAILRLLIGDDIMNGKVTPKKAAPVERGRSPAGIRSDVSGKGKGALTEHEKRKARLQNVRI